MVHIRHSGEAHPAVITIKLESVSNVAPGIPYYLKFNYKRQDSKTKARVADENGTAMFDHQIVLETMLYEKGGSDKKKVRTLLHNFCPCCPLLR